MCRQQVADGSSPPPTCSRTMFVPYRCETPIAGRSEWKAGKRDTWSFFFARRYRWSSSATPQPSIVFCGLRRGEIRIKSMEERWIIEKTPREEKHLRHAEALLWIKTKIKKIYKSYFLPPVRVICVRYVTVRLRIVIQRDFFIKIISFFLVLVTKHTLRRCFYSFKWFPAWYNVRWISLKSISVM